MCLRNRSSFVVIGTVQVKVETKEEEDRIRFLERFRGYTCFELIYTNYIAENVQTTITRGNKL
jgi:hypothetical protein